MVNRRSAVFGALAAAPAGLLMRVGTAVGQGGTGAATGSPLVVIVPAGSPLSNLPFDRLKALFFGDVVEVSGIGRLVPFNQPANVPDRVAFDRAVLGLEPAAMASYWVDRRVRGGGSPPRTGDVSILQRLVLRFPGAISYVRADQLIAGVRALRLDGKLPTDSGYPLAGR